LGDAAASGTTFEKYRDTSLKNFSLHAGENDLSHMFDGSTVAKNQNQDRELQ